MSEEIKSHHLRALACDIEDCHNPQSWADYCRAAANRIETQAAEIARLRAELATARQDALAEIKQDTDELIEQGRQDGMEYAAQRLEALHKNHQFNPLTGEGSEHDVGYYRALAEGAAHILCAAAKEGKP